MLRLSSDSYKFLGDGVCQAMLEEAEARYKAVSGWQDI